MEKVCENKVISSIENKLQYLEENLNTNVFNNPIRENLLEVRNELLDFARTLEEEILTLSKTNVI